MIDTYGSDSVQNYQRMLSILKTTLAQAYPELERHTKLVGTFKTTFDLACDVLKEFLESQGRSVSSRRSIFNVAFHSHLIYSFSQWMQAQADLNWMAIADTRKTRIETERLIRYTYYPMLNSLVATLEEQLSYSGISSSSAQFRTDTYSLSC
jgi:hypothetical protein